MRRLVSQGLTGNGMVVVGEAASADEARTQIKLLSPDVLTLDIEMPGMNGLQFLENLMRLRPMPVVMVSTLTAERAPAALAAFELGALDVVLKPTSTAAVATFHDELAEKVRWAAQARRPLLARRVEEQLAPLRAPAWIDGTVIVLGASTGGTEALQQVFRQLPADLPPIVIVQHIPAGFSTAFAATLNRISAVTVTEAEDGDVLEAGRAYVAPGGRQLRIQTRGTRRRLRVTDEGRHNHHAPSVDLLFGSLAPGSGDALPIVAGLLTGMGADGAVGLKALHDIGARTFAQDQVSSVVWGMPQAAIRLGAADEVLGVRDIATCIVRFVGAQHMRAPTAMAR